MRLGDREPVRVRLAQAGLDGAALEELAHDVGLRALLPDVEDGDDVRVIAQAAHRLRLAPDAGQTVRVEPFGLHHRDRDVGLEARVAREIDPLAGALAEEALHAVAPAAERGRERDRGRSRRARRRDRAAGADAGAAAGSGAGAPSPPTAWPQAMQKRASLGRSRPQWRQRSACDAPQWRQ
jgi:hypothetical protein